jgi:hypothetical protein
MGFDRPYCTARGVRADARLEIARHVYDTLYQPVDTETAKMALP